MPKFKVTKNGKSSNIIADQDFVEKHYPGAWEQIPESDDAAPPAQVETPNKPPKTADEIAAEELLAAPAKDWKPADQTTAMRLILAKLYVV